MSKRRSGLNPLAYLGVEAATPPNLVVHNRAPTANDYAEYNIGDMWIFVQGGALPEQIWILTSKSHYVSTWQIFNAGIVPGDITDVLGGDNINTVNSGGPIVTVNLNKSIFQPATNAAGTEGLYALDGNDFMHAYGIQNVFLGTSAGNRTLTVGSATENTGLGYQALHGITTAELCTAVGDTALGTATTSESCTAIGHDSQALLTTGDFNTSVGGESLARLVTGNYNSAHGFRAGYSYQGAESSNIVIGSAGILGDSHIIRIGVQGVGDGEQDQAFMAGIYTTAPAGTYEVVFVDDDGQLSSSKGDDGEIIIGSTAGSPVWGSIVSGDGSIVITPGANTIDLSASVGAETFNTDIAGPAALLGTAITMAGEGVIYTDGTVANTVTIGITNGTNGQLLIGGGANAAWASLVSGDGSVTFTPGANSLDVRAPGGGGGGGSTTFITDFNSPAVVDGANITFAGDGVLSTDGGSGSHVVTISLDDGLSGQLIIGGNGAGAAWASLASAGGTIAITPGVNTLNLELAAGAGGASSFVTDIAGPAASLAGVINMAGAGVIYTDGTVANTVTTGITNGTNGQLIIGGGAAPAWANLVSGDGSVTFALGANSIDIRAPGGGGGGGATTFITDTNSPAVVDGANITFAGAGILNTDGGSGSHVVTTSITNGTAGQLIIGGGAAPVWGTLASGGTIGFATGANTLSLDIVDGAQGQVLLGGGGAGVAWGTLATDGTITFTPGVNSLSLAVTGGVGAQTFTTDAGVATTAAGDIDVYGGFNINTTGAADAVNINLNRSIVQPVTNATGTEGLYSLGAARFLHNYGTYNTFCGSSAGNLTLTVLNSTDNTSLGSLSLSSLTVGAGNSTLGSDSGRSINSGSNNTALGFQSQLNTTTGSNNCSVGSGSLNGITTGSSNCCIGTASGSSITVSDSSNILIGNAGSAGLNNTIKIGVQGTGAGQQNAAYMAGVYNTAVGGTNQFMVVDNTGKLGSTAIVPGDVTTVNGGTNITCVNPGGPVVTVNLDHIVILDGPDAHLDIGEGYWGRIRLSTTGSQPSVFLGQYCNTVNRWDAESVFIGYQAGQSGGASYSVGIGGGALMSLQGANYANNALGYYAGASLTTGSGNTLIGSLAGRYLTTGSVNTLLGSSTGQNYTSTEQGNILIGWGVEGTPGEDHTLRIGEINPLYPNHIADAYIAGIWNKNLGATPTQTVYIDANGHLGTTATETCAFLGIQNFTINNVTGDGTLYWLGTSTNVDEIYDLTNNYNAGGGGVRATFTAPVDGLYFLEMQCLVTNLIAPPAPPPAPPPVYSDPTIYTSNRSYMLINSIYDYQVSGQQSYFYSVVADMDAADVAQFNIDIQFGAGTRTLGIGANQTFISGYLIRRI